METTPTPTFEERLQAALRRLEFIPKTGNNNFHHYTYVTEAEVKRRVRAELLAQDIIVGDVQVELNGTPSEAMVKVRLELLDAHGGPGAICIEGVGGAKDKGDKAVFKAVAGAVKYALTTWGLIPTGDDPEDPENDRAAAKPAKRRKAAAKTSGPADDSNAAVDEDGNDW